jgi:hypothetical protein
MCETEPFRYHQMPDGAVQRMGSYDPSKKFIRQRGHPKVDIGEYLNQLATWRWTSFWNTLEEITTSVPPIDPLSE